MAWRRVRPIIALFGFATVIAPSLQAQEQAVEPGLEYEALRQADLEVMPGGSHERGSSR